MPLYTYSCPDCRIEVEKLRPLEGADWPVSCPACGKECFRTISMFSFVGGKEDRGGAAGPRRTSGGAWNHKGGCPCCAPRR